MEKPVFLVPRLVPLAWLQVTVGARLLFTVRVGEVA